MNPSFGLMRYVAAGAAAMALALLAIGCGGDDTVNPPPVTATLTSVSVNPTTVAGGGSVQGTVTFSSAPSSAANVALSSNNAAATVPATVIVNAGATSVNFTVGTSAVGASTAVTITATFSGTTVSATLTVTAPVLAANFTVKASSAVQRKLSSDPAPVTILPAGTEDACPLVNANFDCVFDGTTSTTPSGRFRGTSGRISSALARDRRKHLAGLQAQRVELQLLRRSADVECGWCAVYRHAGRPAGSGCGGKHQHREEQSERADIPGWSVRLRVLTKKAQGSRLKA